MKINLMIQTKKKYCGLYCMFKDCDGWDTSATCMLFKETLRPKMKYGSVEGWERCEQCHKVARGAEDNR